MEFMPLFYQYPDTDGDGVLDGADNCPYVYNPGQFDADADGLGDACDPNWGDGSACDFDAECSSGNCVNAVTAVWYDTHIGACCPGGQHWVVNHCEACTDFDGDEVCEDPASPYEASADNCPDVFNPGQEDLDGDGTGDACDAFPNDPNEL